MKYSNKLLSLTLTILVCIGLVLSYYMIFDTRSFEQFIANQRGNEISQVQTIPSQTALTPYPFEPFNQPMSTVVSPIQSYYRVEAQSFWIHTPEIRRAFLDLVNSDSIEMNETEIITNEGTLNYLWEIDHLQFVFPNPIPLGVYSNVLELDQDISQDYSIDRIVIPLIPDEEGLVYFVNTESQSFLLGQLKDDNGLDKIHTRMEYYQDDFIVVSRYRGVNSPIYLPIEPLDIPSEIYTLEMIPENMYVNEIFPNTDFSVFELNTTSDTTIFRYQNYLNTLDINRSQQSIQISPNRVDQGESRTYTEKLRNAYQFVQRYEYWSGNIQLYDASPSTAEFRRTLNGLPIYALDTMMDYSLIAIQMRNDSSGDVYRYIQPLLVTNIHIDNMSEDIQLADEATIVENLQANNLLLSSFDNVFVGYEWLPNMEGYRKVELKPTWFFQYRGTIYTYDEVFSNEFIEFWFAEEREEA